MSNVYPDIHAEQVYLDAAYAALAGMQHRTHRATEIADRAVREEQTVDARIARSRLQQRQRDLTIGDAPLVFGRIGELDGDSWYVGRRHVNNEAGTELVVDWRAPVAAPFYRATVVDPCGLDFRRRFSCSGQTIEAMFDEDLADPDGSSAGGLPDPLLAELDRSRGGQMRDIVATIAAEQDEIIRAGIEELLIVQGGPGTGKTAVGLHRAAYLLFAHRDLLHEHRVLVVGPNPVFLRYIADVLPSLGETSVVQTTLDGLLAANYRVTASEPEAVAELKGSVVMAELLRRLVIARLRLPTSDLEMHAGTATVRLEPHVVEGFQKTALSRKLPANVARESFRTMLIQEAWRRHSRRQGVDPAEQAHMVRQFRNHPRFKKDVDRLWPTMSAPAIVGDLLGSPTKRKAAAAGLLDHAEQTLLARPAGRSRAQQAWTASDIALIDEATALVKGVPATYGHIVVDEAQDISPMGLRMLARRSRAGSMTILGDLAQATKPASARSWDDVVERLGEVVGVSPKVRELTVGYRVPSSVLDLANSLLLEAAPDVTPARSVRSGGSKPMILRVAPAEVVAAVVDEAGEIETGWSIGVIAPADLLDQIVVAFGERSVSAIALTEGRGAKLQGADVISVVDPDQAKGLEFDATIVVEPSLIAAMDNGWRRLYVSLTRCVRSLAIVTSRPLPGPIEAGLR